MVGDSHFFSYSSSSSAATTAITTALLYTYCCWCCCCYHLPQSLTATNPPRSAATYTVWLSLIVLIALFQSFSSLTLNLMLSIHNTDLFQFFSLFFFRPNLLRWCSPCGLSLARTMISPYLPLCYIPVPLTIDGHARRSLYPFWYVFKHSFISFLVTFCRRT